jgi:hypothetical protein
MINQFLSIGLEMNELRSLQVRESHPLATNNFNIETALPAEPVRMIFNFLPVLGKEWNAPTFVCKRWSRLFEEQHLFKCLKKGQYPLFLDRPVLVSTFAQNITTLDKINKALGCWINPFIRNYSQTSNVSFIVDNMWLTSFDPHLSCPHPEINKILKSVEKLDIAVYLPDKHFQSVIKQEKLPEKILKEALRLEYIWSEKILKEVLRLEYIRLSHISFNQRTTEICLIAVQKEGLDLEHVPENLKNPEICLIAVQKHGLALQFVPDNQRTNEICLAAVQQNEIAVRYVPEHIRISVLSLELMKFKWL